MRDSDVRLAVKDWLQAKHAHDNDTRIVEEMGIWSGSVRIDIAVINGELSGFELKSDRDTLERLPQQADIYSRVFDQVHLVVGARHSQKASAVVPDWWGITVATQNAGKVELSLARSALPNPAPEPYLIAQLLWREEAVSVLEAFGLAKGWRSKRMKLIHERLAIELPLQELKSQVRSLLKTRRDWLTAKVSERVECGDLRQS
jgi:hypothetical protein